MSDSKLLLVWQQVPEEIQLYEFGWNDVELREKLMAAHGKYVNGDEDDSAALAVNRLLVGVKPIYSSTGNWFQIDPEGNTPESEEDHPDTVSVAAPELLQMPELVGNYCTVVVSGFLM